MAINFIDLIPDDIYASLSASSPRVEGALRIEFWSDDEEDLDNLGLFLTPGEIDRIGDFGISYELLQWMRQENMVQKEDRMTEDNVFASVDVFLVTNDVIENFLMQTP